MNYLKIITNELRIQNLRRRKAGREAVREPRVMASDEETGKKRRLQRPRKEASSMWPTDVAARTAENIHLAGVLGSYLPGSQLSETGAGAGSHSGLALKAT